MACPALLFDPATCVVLRNLWLVIDTICRTSLDLSLEACAVLVDVASRPEGLALRDLKQRYGFCAEATDFERLLAEQDLVTLSRSAHDRRSHALAITTKGTDRALLVDRALGLGLVTAFPALTEESLDKLVGLFHEFAQATGDGFGDDRLFPAAVLATLALFRAQAVLAASRFAMTWGQMVILFHHCVDRPGLRNTFGNTLAHPDDMAAVEVLRSRGLISEGEPALCTESGNQRVTEFTQRLAMLLNDNWEAAPARVRTALGRLLPFVLYLFS